MLQRRHQGHQLRLYAYCLLCAGLTACSTTGGNFELGRADAQIANLEKQYPEIAVELQDIRSNLKSAQDEIQQKEKTIDLLAVRMEELQKKADSRLLWIWKLTTATLSLLLVAGGYIFWKLK